MNYKGIIFDFNGTLYWDSAKHKQAWREFSKILRGTEFSDEEMVLHMFGRTKEEIIESATKLVVTKKSLYAEAVKSGIKVTDEEYKAYKNLVKDSMENAENKEDIQAYFDGFGGEENYWKQMKVVIMENLAIRKYMNELTQNESDIVGYSENNNYDDIVQQQNMEQQIKDNVYDETLSEQEKEKLKEVAGELYEEVEKTSK